MVCSNSRNRLYHSIYLGLKGLNDCMVRLAELRLHSFQLMKDNSIYDFTMYLSPVFFNVCKELFVNWKEMKSSTVNVKESVF